MGEGVMALAILASAVGLSFLATYITGRGAEWLFRNVTLSREPAFAGFVAAMCLGIGRIGREGVEADGPADAVIPLLMLAGTIAALFLLWRQRVRAERRIDRAEQIG